MRPSRNLTGHTYHARHAAPTPVEVNRAARWLATATVASLCATGLTFAGGASAGAAPVKPKPRDPIASTPKIAAVPGGLKITGWALDPDSALTNLRVAAVMDGTKTLGSTPTTLPNAGVTKKYRSGTTPGYALTVPVPTGKRIVCVVLDNLGGGQRVVKRCVATPLGRKLTKAQVTKRSPRGVLLTAAASSTTVRVTGWASDPDLVSRRGKVVVYLNGRKAASRTTTAYAGTLPAGAGRSSRFDISVPATRATQIVCVRALNVGFGRTTFFGCRALDPRPTGAATANPTAPVAVPQVNAKVVALAKKQIGKPYVWGAVGPKSFDCSGIVMWAYGKYGVKTPRVSQDQIKAARLIPASRAVAGDLVFYHDSFGDVYHVGIYLKPGLSVAAISSDQGVDYQRIWDPTATYGSFTHT